MTKAERLIVWYMPVIHQGYVRYWYDLTKETAEKFSIIGISPALAVRLQTIQTDPATLSTETVNCFWKSICDQQITWLDADFFVTAAAVRDLLSGIKTVELIDDAVGRKFWQFCVELAHMDRLPEVHWHSVFLRWDAHSVQQENQIQCNVTHASKARKWMLEAKKYAEKSSDWWRQVGSIAVKNDSEIMRAYNQGMPDDHTPYQAGAVRDYLPVGQKPELANYIHAEQAIIAESAKQGVSLADCDLYVTHFPCPVCAKLIAKAGIKRVFFLTGSATLDGLQVMQSYGITIARVSE